MYQFLAVYASNTVTLFRFAISPNPRKNWKIWEEKKNLLLLHVEAGQLLPMHLAHWLTEEDPKHEETNKSRQKKSLFLIKQI